MKYGNFDDATREYVITTPHLPFPWINYLGVGDFFGLISNTAGGYCFYQDARLRRLLRYRYNSVPVDSNGRYFYIVNGDDIWSPGWKPVKAPLDRYECRHGMSYTRILGERNGIRADALYFVPLHDTCEIHHVTLHNTTDKSVRLKLFSCVEFCLWNAYDDMTNFQRNLNTGEVVIDNSTIYHITEYRERRSHYAFYSVNRPICGSDSDRDAFLGPERGYELPRAVQEGHSRNSKADGWSPIASHSIEIELAPGGSSSVTFVLGYVENSPDNKWSGSQEINKQKAQDLIARYRSDADVQRAMTELRQYWDGLLSVYTANTPDQCVNRMANIWNQYQCMVTLNLSRSASLFESGIGRGIGFRDSNQDILGVAHMAPQRARQRLIDLAATQLPDGSAYHQYQPLTKKGNNDIGSGFNDDPLWLIAGVSAYLKETGDLAILDQNIPFDCDPADSEPLFEHLRRSLNHVIERRGPHGLPLIGRADWNDCLNLNCFSSTPDESFQTCTNKDGMRAESVMIAGMFVLYGKEFAAICAATKRETEAQMVLQQVARMEQAIKDHGWDGEWFLRAYDDSQKVIGSHSCDEGKIFIESQGICAMAGVGRDDNLTTRALDSVKNHLDTGHGIVLLWPAYSQYHVNLGEISSYPPGYKENGGVFCHNNAWVIIAECVAGRGDRAFEYYRKIAPAFREDISDVHRMEPYVYAQMIAGKEALRHGEAKNSWLTGTAAWNFVALSQWILGVRPELDGLRISPCIPRQWCQFSIERSFRNARYLITVQNPSAVSTGVISVTIDGQPHKGNLLPIFGDGREHIVEVLMG